ncbi:uncharacterized protein LOC119591322 [Penaeus monodon]|uniref:uncharacterized protein LOC119591322 n=1 Tax=Penaeus monodon TaxID=6687 RepID=UPI0018A6EE40|nr:uncharacterized protein LOC119591322 [Penaeus monodon]
MLLTGIFFILVSQTSDGGKVSLTDSEVGRKNLTWNQKVDVRENFRSRTAALHTKLEGEEKTASFRVFEGSGYGSSGSDDDEENDFIMAQHLSESNGNSFNKAYELDTCSIPDKDDPGKVVCNFTNIPQIPSRLPQSLYRRVSLTELYVYGSRKLHFRTLCLEELQFINCRDVDAIDYRSAGTCGVPLDSLQLSNSRVGAITGNFNKVIVNNSVVGSLEMSLTSKSKYILVNASDIITLRGLTTGLFNHFWISQTRVRTTLGGGLTVNNSHFRSRPSNIEAANFESIEPGGIQVRSGRLRMLNVTIGHLGDGGLEILGSAEVRMVHVTIKNSSFEGISLKGLSAVLYMQNLELNGVVLSVRFVSKSPEPFIFHPMRLFLHQASLFDTAVTKVLCALAFTSGVLAGALVTYCCCLRKKGTTKIHITEPPQNKSQSVEDTAGGGGGRGRGAETSDTAAFRSAQVLRAEAEQEPIYGNIRQPLCQARDREPIGTDKNKEPLYQDTYNEALYQDTSREPVYQDTGIEPLYQDTSTELGIQSKTGRTPIYQDKGKTPVYRDAGTPPIYQDTGRTPVYQDAGTPPIYQDTGRTPINWKTGGVEKTHPQDEQDRSANEEPIYGNVEQEPIYGNIGTDTHSGPLACEDDCGEAIYANFSVDEEIYANI